MVVLSQSSLFKFPNQDVYQPTALHVSFLIILSDWHEIKHPGLQQQKSELDNSVAKASKQVL